MNDQAYRQNGWTDRATWENFYNAAQVPNSPESWRRASIGDLPMSGMNGSPFWNNISANPGAPLTAPTPQPPRTLQAPITARMQQIYSGFNTPAVSSVAYRPPGNPYVPSMAPNGAGRPVGSLVASPRSEPVSQAVTQAYGTRTANQAAANQSLADWTREFLANRPRAQQYAAEETGAIGRNYGTGADSVQGELARIRQQRATAIRDMTEAAYRRAGRSNNMRRMGSGNSSYMDRLYAQDMGQIGSQAAVQGFDQERNDAMYLNQQRTGLAGTRQGLMDQLLQREMMPVQARSMVEGENLGRVGQIAGLDYGNNSYENTEDAYRRRAEYLQELMSMGVQV